MIENPVVEVRPWGNFEVLSDAKDHKVKRISILPKKRLSLQRHRQRAEHWYIVKGIGIATVGDKKITVEGGMSIDIKCGETHRIENTSNMNLVFIEVQTGDYFGEDDIERLEDDYGRI